MKLVVGLGNPGPEYVLSPHNLGFAVVEELARRHAAALTRKESHSLCARATIAAEEVWLIQPQTYMNLSGTAVREWLRKKECGAEDLLVIHDELDLPWGRIQIRKGGGAAGHHGIESIIDSIGTRDFLRLRLGIAPERNGERDEQERVRYLLRPVPRAARKAMAALIEEAAGAAEMLIAEGPAKAMNRYNRRDLAGGQKPGEAKDREKKQAGGTAGHETGSN